MGTLQFGDQQFAYRVRRTNRKKTIGITVKASWEVILHVPYRTPEEKIRQVVRKKAGWIVKRLQHLAESPKAYPAKEYISGEQLLYLGRSYRLKIEQTTGNGCTTPALIGRRLCLSVGEKLDGQKKRETIKNRLKTWYGQQADRIIKERVKRYAPLLEAHPAEIKIRDQKTRWGSCSTSGTIRFNWRVVLAPMKIIDYVVVHELCHLKVKNHSREFWRQVALIFLDHKERRAWLRTNSRLLRIE